MQEQVILVNKEDEPIGMMNKLKLMRKVHYIGLYLFSYSILIMNF